MKPIAAVFGANARRNQYDYQLFSGIRRSSQIPAHYDYEECNLIYPGSDYPESSLAIKRRHCRAAGCGNCFGGCLHCNVCEGFKEQ